MTDDRLALIADARLPGDARVMGLFVLELGEGWHEVAHDQFRAILDGPSDETLRRHLRKLEGTGWIEADTNTGRRPPRYRIREASETQSGGFRAPVLASLPHTNGGERDVSPTPQRGKGSSAPHRRGVEPPVVDRREEDREKIEEEETREPLSDEIEELVSGDRLAGCRDTLRDYLVRRVPPPRRYGFVHTLLGWIEGIDASVFSMPTGGSLPPTDRTSALAAGMNELLAADERKMKRDPGDPGNLKTKLSILMQQRGRNGKRQKGTDSGGNRGSSQGEAGTVRSDIASGQGEHHVEW